MAQGFNADDAATAPAARWTLRQIAVAVRVLILALVFVLAVITHHHIRTFSWLGGLCVMAAVASARGWGPRLAPIVGGVESLVLVVAVLETHAGKSVLFPYLLAPAFAAALESGLPGALIGPGLAGLAFVTAGQVESYTEEFAPNTAQWVVLAAASGIVAWWIGRLIAPAEGLEPDTSYAAAYRLLAQLRPVARQLSVGLDPVTIAEGLLQSLRTHYDFERGVVLVRTGGGRLVPLAHYGGTREDWDVDITGDGPFAEAWLSQRPQRLTRQLTGAQGSAIVLPLVIGLRSFGLVGLETAHRSWAVEDVATARRVIEEASLRLETAMLFDEVRGVATAEERRRLAREIHDGIAQELSYLGYVVDSLGADAREAAPALAEQLKQLRAEITRIVSELRLSIFDLRSEVDVHGGLGAALSEYVRSVGQQSHLTVHLSLDEAATRLPAESEAELLRIAQEAITNARKHAEADNLWVTLVVDPPRALLRVEDDGRGLGRARSDSYGLQIMRERASRLRTKVDVEPREPNGTRVEVALGADAPAPTRLEPVPSTPGSSQANAGLEEMPST